MWIKTAAHRQPHFQIRWQRSDHRDGGDDYCDHCKAEILPEVAALSLNAIPKNGEDGRAKNCQSWHQHELQRMIILCLFWQAQQGHANRQKKEYQRKSHHRLHYPAPPKAIKQGDEETGRRDGKTQMSVALSELAFEIPRQFSQQLTEYHGGGNDGEITLEQGGLDIQQMCLKKCLGPTRGSPQTFIIHKPHGLSPPPSAATQTFLSFWVESNSEAQSLESYYRTKFFRLLVSLRKLTQDALRPMYTWVPIQTWDRQWTDAALYKKYKLTGEAIAYIEAVIRPMELSGDASDE